jgi:predicted AlkP superfamily phosphohydrolase/phosphomutase
VVEYEYDLESWLADEGYAPLRDYYLGKAVPFHFQLDDAILSSVEKARSYTSSMAEAVYRVRINVIGPTGDRIYCYQRNLDPNMPGDVRKRIDKVNEERTIARQHAEIASRMS